MITLVGLPGCGKSTLGRQLSRLTGRSFVDVDAQIETLTGLTVARFFQTSGEAAFRELETICLAKILSGDALNGNSWCQGAVVATGGGAMMCASTRDLVHAVSQCIYIHALPSQLADRLRSDTKRPMFQGVDPLIKLTELYASRDPQYRAASHHVIDTFARGTTDMVRLMANLVTVMP